MILNNLIDNQSVYNNVIFQPANKKVLFLKFPHELNNMKFYNCRFDMLCITNTTLTNCLFDHCTFNKVFIDKNNIYDNTVFSCCIFNEGRIYRADEICINAVYNTTQVNHIINKDNDRIILKNI